MGPGDRGGWWRAVVIAVAAVAVAGCGSGSSAESGSTLPPADAVWPSATELAGWECPTKVTSEDPARDMLVIVTADAWVRLGPEDLEWIEGAEPVPQKGVVIASDPVEPPPPPGFASWMRLSVEGRQGWPSGTKTVSLSGRRVADLHGEISRGASVIVGVGKPVGDGRALLGVAHSLRPDGSVVGIGHCMPEAMLRWLDEQVASGRYGSHAEVVSAVLGAEDPVAAYLASPLVDVSGPPPPLEVWEGTDPMERHWHLAPIELQVGLGTANVGFVVPEAWRGVDGQLCTRTPAAWGPCVDLGAGYFADGVESLAAVHEVGLPLEIWFVEGDDLARSHRLGSVSAEELAARPELVVGLVEVGGSKGSKGSQRPVAEIVGLARDGGVRLELSDGPLPETEVGGATSTAVPQ